MSLTASRGGSFGFSFPAPAMSGIRFRVAGKGGLVTRPVSLRAKAQDLSDRLQSRLHELDLEEIARPQVPDWVKHTVRVAHVAASEFELPWDGGRARVTSEQGAGTEVELTLERQA